MDEKFYAALGRFVIAFSSAEHGVNSTLAIFSKTYGPVGRAIFSGTRAKGAIDFVRRIHEAQGIEMHPGLAAIFAQMNAINTMRDKLLHQGVKDDDLGGFITSNINYAHTEKALQAFPVSIEILERMTVDLRIIDGFLSFHYVPEDLKGRPLTPSLQDIMQAMVAGRDGPLPSWRYKSPQPALAGRKTPKTTPRRGRPPPTSQE